MDKESIQQLLHPRAFNHAVTRCELIETHISWVILTGNFAYKIKKPVNFDFLDFSTLALRRHYCEEELRLNRRFAPELYLAVVPVVTANGEMVVDAVGEIVDYAVKMRQFAAAELLDAIAAAGALTPAMIRQLARKVAAAHQQLPVVEASAALGSIEHFRTAQAQNFQQIGAFLLAPDIRQRLSVLAQWWQQQYQQQTHLLRSRLDQGLVKECHGDLHLGNMAFVNGEVLFFDCIEFNRAFRVMDTIAEIALLSMDMSARGLTLAAQTVLNDYLEYSGDYAGLRLLDIFRSYYAVVRAKVNLLRENVSCRDLQATAAYCQFSTYLQLAERYRQARPRYLALMHGVSGTGKSTVAAELAARTQAIRLRSDVERKRLFGLAPEASSHTSDKLDIYTRAASERTFASLLSLAEHVLRSGYPCVVDATFLHRAARAPFVALAQRLQVPVYILDCRATTAVINQRLLQRTAQGNDPSEADRQIMEQQLQQVELFAPEEEKSRREINTEKPLAEALGELIGELRVVD